MKITIEQMPAFKKAYKRLFSKEKTIVDTAISKIVKDPTIGEEKRGDLAGIFVYKFRIDNREMLLAYEWVPSKRLLIALGVHENFYRDLKRKV